MGTSAADRGDNHSTPMQKHYALGRMTAGSPSFEGEPAITQQDSRGGVGDAPSYQIIAIAALVRRNSVKACAS